MNLLLLKHGGKPHHAKVTIEEAQEYLTRAHQLEQASPKRAKTLPKTTEALTTLQVQESDKNRLKKINYTLAQHKPGKLKDSAAGIISQLHLSNETKADPIIAEIFCSAAENIPPQKPSLCEGYDKIIA